MRVWCALSARLMSCRGGIPGLGMLPLMLIAVSLIFHVIIGRVAKEAAIIAKAIQIILPFCRAMSDCVSLTGVFPEIVDLLSDMTLRDGAGGMILPSRRDIRR